MTSNEVRQAFLNYFKEKKHEVIPSSSLVPRDDPTLLLTTAGMVQIKPYFLGLAVPPRPRLASCQKCFRTTDIDSVGDSTHLTFFEMLGNFSVGDYFKAEAIEWGWEFVIERLKVPPEKLWVTIYLDDDEAFNCWRAIGFPEEKIVRLGEKDNFWGPAGDSGPCGPCSEIHYDFGSEAGCGRSECRPGCECGRFSEIWNLVFTQYNQDREGKRTPLPKPNIDTGMGLERTTAVMQGVSSVYETDLFVPIMKKIMDLAGKDYGREEAADRAIRVIAEHSRGVAFLIADGVLPSNEGRGYVLRRILRRASFFGRKLGIEGPFLSEVTEVIVDQMGNIYPELVAGQDFMNELLETEEEKFISTLDAGIALAESSTEAAIKHRMKQITGEEVFKLWDTYGFPSELSAEIAQGRGLTIDIAGFEAEMQKQRRRGRKARKFDVSVSSDNSLKAEVRPEGTDFIGYDKLSNESRVIYILEQESGNLINDAKEGQNIGIVLDITPFYGEMGGQVGDTGRITLNSSQVDISNTVWSPYGRLAEGAIIHLGKVVKGKVSKGDIVQAEVDTERRLDIARNHTATHLLQTALRRVLGVHVNQRGSLVAPDHLRFDFSHIKTIDKQQLNKIQNLVNEMIRQNLIVTSKEVPYKKAIEEGAIALFDEKYGEKVRVLEIGKPSKSMELCGGTHVRSTGEIGLFFITSEGSIGTGLRRIEAVTGRGAEAFITKHIEVIKAVAEDLKSSPLEIKEKVAALVTDLNMERKRCISLERKLSGQIVDELVSQAEQVNGISVVAAKIPSSSIPALREIGDALRDRLKSAVIVLGTIQDNRPGFIAMVTSDLMQKGLHAGEIVKQVAGITGGGGGGRADMSQAGGKDKSKIDEALRAVKNIVQKLC